MKYNLKLFPLGPNGKKVVDETGSELDYRGLLIGLCANGLGENGQPVQGRAKLKFYDIYLKLKDASEVELSSDEVGLLNAAAINLPILVAGQAVAFLDHPMADLKVVEKRATE